MQIGEGSNNWDYFGLSYDHMVKEDEEGAFLHLDSVSEEGHQPDYYDSENLFCHKAVEFDLTGKGLEQLEDHCPLPSNVSFIKLGWSFQEQELEEQGSTVQNSGTTSQLRMVNRIDTTTDKLCERSRCLKGGRSQTKNIGKFVYAETVKYLKTLFQIKVLSKQSHLSVKTFIQKKGSIDSFECLFQNQQVREKCRDFFESSSLIRGVLLRGMQMSSKIIGIKYLQKIRRMSLGQTGRWKD